MDTVENTVSYIRSKNAGPFWITIDAFCDSAKNTERVSAAFENNRNMIAEAFHVNAKDLLIYSLLDIQVAKISMPRSPVQGNWNELDMHGGQQYVTLLDIPC